MASHRLASQGRQIRVAWRGQKVGLHSSWHKKHISRESRGAKRGPRPLCDCVTRKGFRKLLRFPAVLWQFTLQPRPTTLTTDDAVRALGPLSEIPASPLPPSLCPPPRRSTFKVPEMTEGRRLICRVLGAPLLSGVLPAAAGAFGPLKNLLPKAPSVHCSDIKPPNAPRARDGDRSARASNSRYFAKFRGVRPFTSHCLSVRNRNDGGEAAALFLPFLRPPVRSFPISRYRGISSDGNGERASERGNGLSRPAAPRGEKDLMGGPKQSRRRRHCELRRMLRPTHPARPGPGSLYL